MSELPLDAGPDISAAAHEAARGHVVYLTEQGQRLAAIVPADFAAALEGMTPDQARELLKHLADGAAAREALEEPAKTSPPSRSGPRSAYEQYSPRWGARGSNPEPTD